MWSSSKNGSQQINVVRTGPKSRTPVILIHPVGLDLTYWGSQIDALCDRYDVLAFDLPGHGRSPGTPESWSFPQAIRVVRELIESTGCQAAHIVGSSFGGMIAQALAVAQPPLVRSLTLLSTACTFSEEARQGMRKRASVLRQDGMQSTLQETLQRWFAETTTVRRPDLIDRATKTLLADDPEIHAAIWDVISSFEVVSELQKVTSPTLIMTGDLDASTPPPSANLLHETITGSELLIVPEISHMLFLEAPALVNAHLLHFLARVPEPTSARRT